MIRAACRVQATQRAGRAGRTQPGKCFRLYTRRYHDEDMAASAVPEIQRASLVTAMLYLKTLPLEIDVLNFDFLDPPSVSSEPSPPRSGLEENLSVTAIQILLRRLQQG